jgi:hypothetical protein
MWANSLVGYLVAMLCQGTTLHVQCYAARSITVVGGGCYMFFYSVQAMYGFVCIASCCMQAASHENSSTGAIAQQQMQPLGSSFPAHLSHCMCYLRLGRQRPCSMLSAVVRCPLREQPCISCSLAVSALCVWRPGIVL